MCFSITSMNYFKHLFYFCSFFFVFLWNLMLINQRKKNDIMGELKLTVSQLLCGCSVSFVKEEKHPWTDAPSSGFDREKQRNKTKCHLKSGARTGRWHPAMITHSPDPADESNHWPVSCPRACRPAGPWCSAKHQNVCKSWTGRRLAVPGDEKSKNHDSICSSSSKQSKTP